MSTISVIIPTYNRKGFLREALQAVQAQSRPVDQIIIWDDGSTDGTDQMIAGINEPRLLYHHAQNAGKSAALNNAMRLATGDYIWICDDDDLAMPDAAQKLAGVLDADATIGIAGGSYQRFRETAQGREIDGPGYWPDLSTGTPLRHLLEDIFLFQNATLVRRSCYDQVGPFREDLARSIDYEMLIRLAVRFPIHMSPDIMFLQRKHDGDRGPARMRHAASHSEQVWAAQDRVVFESLRDHLPLSLFLAMFAGTGDLPRRAAHLQRACIFARHDLWQDALIDLQAAAKIAHNTLLTADEIVICRRAVSGKHGVHLAPAHFAMIRELRETEPAGVHIAASLGRGLLWSLRKALEQRDRVEAIRLGQLLWHLGVSFRAPDHAPDLHERAALSDGAYGW